MFLGKPVIATDWSGNRDFMNQSNSCLVKYELIALDRDYGPYPKGGLWAEPDIEHAAWYMRKLVERESWGRRIGEAARASVCRDLSYAAVGRRIADRLSHINGRMACR